MIQRMDWFNERSLHEEAYFVFTMKKYWFVEFDYFEWYESLAYTIKCKIF